MRLKLLDTGGESRQEHEEKRPPPCRSGNVDGAYRTLDKARVFLSYRRADGADASERLERFLKTQHPRMKVFRDLTRLSGGERFADRIFEEVDDSNAMVVFMGPAWLGQGGRARLFERGDMCGRKSPVH